MKILIIHNKYKSNNIGGEDIVFKNELLLLAQKLGRENVFTYTEENDSINVFKLLFRFIFSLKHFLNIRKTIIKNSITHVHIHNYFPMLTPAVFWSTYGLNCKVIHTLHNFRWWCANGVLYRKNHGICTICIKKTFPLFSVFYKCYSNSYLLSLGMQLMTSLHRCLGVLNRVDAYFVLTNFQINILRDIGINESKIFLKPNFMPNMTLKDNPKLYDFIYVGRLEEEKGVLLLLSTWKRYNIPYKLIIIGDTTKSNDLLTQYSISSIEFLGKKDHDTTLKLMSQSRYLLQTSLMVETFGLTIVEAMSMGLPVIGFNIGTRTEMIQNDENGFLCEPTAEKLSQVITKAHTWDNYKELSRNAHQFSLNFAADRIIQLQIELYKKVQSL